MPCTHHASLHRSGATDQLHLDHGLLDQGRVISVQDDDDEDDGDDEDDDDDDDEEESGMPPGWSD
jgi:hypothetical protein